MIKLEHVSKTFHTEKLEVHAVKDVSLTIEDGEIFGIIGFSGAGKSTLVRCINLLERPTEGSVKIDEQEMTELSAKELRKARKKIGMIFQHFNLMPSRTVRENVAFPLRKSGLTKAEMEDKARKLLERVEISDKGNTYPSQLSGGQKQRVAIARALANDPKILLCDEATSALDPQTTNAILDLLKHLNEELGITVVIITHEMAVVKKICHRVAIMEQGEVIECGKVFDIFTNPQKHLTKEFIGTTSNLTKVEELLEENSSLVQVKEGDVLTRLTYIKRDVLEPLISDTSRTYEVNLNIIFADVGIVDGAPIGGTVVIFQGVSENIDAALEGLKKKCIGVEVVRDARIH